MFVSISYTGQYTTNSTSNIVLGAVKLDMPGLGLSSFTSFREFFLSFGAELRGLALHIIHGAPCREQTSSVRLGWFRRMRFGGQGRSGCKAIAKRGLVGKQHVARSAILRRYLKSWLWSKALNWCLRAWLMSGRESQHSIGVCQNLLGPLYNCCRNQRRKGQE